MKLFSEKVNVVMPRIYLMRPVPTQAANDCKKADALQGHKIGPPALYVALITSWGDWQGKNAQN